MDYSPWIVSPTVGILADMSRDYEQIRKQLADKIKILRSQKGLSQEGLALSAELDRSYISQIERGVGNPSLLVLCKLAAILDTDVVDLIRES